MGVQISFMMFVYIQAKSIERSNIPHSHARVNPCASTAAGKAGVKDALSCQQDQLGISQAL